MRSGALGQLAGDGAELPISNGRPGGRSAQNANALSGRRLQRRMAIYQAECVVRRVVRRVVHRVVRRVAASAERERQSGLDRRRSVSLAAAVALVLADAARRVTAPEEPEEPTMAWRSAVDPKR